MQKIKDLRTIGQNVLALRPIRNIENKLNTAELQFLPPLLGVEETPPSPLAHILLRSIAALVSITVSWSYFGEIDVYTTAAGKVVPDGRIKLLQPNATSFVSSIRVKEGDFVRKDQVLVELDPASNNADLKSTVGKQVMLRLELARLRSELYGKPIDTTGMDVSAEQMALQDALKMARDSGFAAKLAEAKNAFESKTMTLRSAEDTLRKTGQLVESTREREAKVRPYVGVVMPRFDYLKLRDDLATEESDLALARSAIRDASEQRQAASQQIAQVSEEHRSGILGEIAEKERSLIALEADNAKLRQLLTDRELKSPVDGQIQSLNISSVGAVVTPGQTIATILPNNSPLVIEGTVSNEDIGYLEVGQSVRIKIDSFPWQRYGSLGGTVTQISPDSEQEHGSTSVVAGQPQGNSTVPTTSGYSYRIRITPAATALIKSGQAFKIKSGMTVQADIKTDRRKIIDFFLSPLQDRLQNGFHSR